MASAGVAGFLFPSFKVCAEILDLPSLLERAESNAFVQRDFEAQRRLASLRRSQVTAEKWLSTVELNAFTGVVPDVDVGNALRDRDAGGLLFDFDSGDLENDFSFNKLGPFMQLELKAVQPLYTWGKISSYYRMAEANERLTEQEKRKMLSQLRFMVKRAFYTLQLSQDSILVLNEVREKLAEAQEKVDELIEKNADNVEENDRLKIRVFVADIENRSLDAFRGLNISRVTLSELAGIEGELELQEPGLSPELVRGVSREALLEGSLEDKPEIRQLKEAIAIRRAERGTLRADLFPSFFVAGQLEYATAPGRTNVRNPYLHDPFNKFNFGLALGLRQDLGFHRHLNKIRQVEARVDSLEAQKAQLSVLTRLQVEDAFTRALNAQQGIRINEEGFRAARSWLTSTGLAFSLGTAPTKDVLESYAAYFKARVDLLKAIYDLNIALAELSVASGSEVVERLQ